LANQADPFHVYPLGDLREHVLEGHGELCWCGVRIEDGIVIHTSADGREACETGARGPS
jgi:hypothetical protein